MDSKLVQHPVETTVISGFLRRDQKSSDMFFFTMMANGKFYFQSQIIETFISKIILNNYVLHKG